MGKTTIYIAIMILIIIIFCSIASVGSKNTTTTTPIVTNNSMSIQIDNNKVTTNIWDYIHEQQSSTGIGESTQEEISKETNLTINVTLN